MLCASSDDDGVSGLGGVLDDLFGKLQNAFAIDQLELVRIQTSFVASAQKGLEEAVVQRIGALLTTLDDGLGTLRELSDLLGEQLVPKLPAELSGQQCGDFAAAASVFAFNGDDFDHLRIPGVR